MISYFHSVKISVSIHIASSNVIFSYGALRKRFFSNDQGKLLQRSWSKHCVFNGNVPILNVLTNNAKIRLDQSLCKIRTNNYAIKS